MEFRLVAKGILILYSTCQISYVGTIQREPVMTEKLTMLNFYQNILIHLTYCKLTIYNTPEFTG